MQPGCLGIPTTFFLEIVVLDDMRVKLSIVPRMPMNAKLCRKGTSNRSEYLKTKPDLAKSKPT